MRLREGLAGDADAPFDLLAHLAGVGIRIGLQAFDVAVDGRHRRHVPGAAFAVKLNAALVEQRAVLDRIGAGLQRQVDAVAAMCMHGNFLAVQMRGLDDRARLVGEHLLAEPGADATVDATGSCELDDIDAARNLVAHRATAVVGAVAHRRIRHRRPQFLTIAEAPVHVPGTGRDRATGVEDARAGYLACGNGVAQRQDHAIAVTEIAHGGEAGRQRLARVDRSLVRDVGDTVGDVRQLAFYAGLVRSQVHMAVDQSRQHEARALVDDRGVSRDAFEGAGIQITIANRFDAVVADQQRRLLARRTAGIVEQRSCVDQRVAVGREARRARDEQEQA